MIRDKEKLNLHDGLINVIYLKRKQQMSLIAFIFSAQLALPDCNQNIESQASHTSQYTQTKQTNAQQVKEKQAEKKKDTGSLFSVSFRISF